MQQRVFASRWLAGKLLLASVLTLGWVAGCHRILGLEGAREERAIGAVEPDAGAAGAAGNVGGPAAGGAPGVASVSPECQTYCEDINDVCLRGERQYQTTRHCEVLCPDILQRRNGCRSTTLTEYREERCSAAGPLGAILEEGEVDEPRSCEPDVCALYCDLMLSTCPSEDLSLGGELGDEFTASNRRQCLDLCNGLEPAGSYTIMPAPLGNNVNCRIHHLNLALEALRSPRFATDLGRQEVVIHCNHAAGGPGNSLTPPCQDE